MNQDNPSLVSKLTLLALALILVCLVLLVVRAYHKPFAPEGMANVADVPTPSEVQEPAIESAPVIAPRPVNRPIRTNMIHAAAPRNPAPPPAPQPPAASLPVPVDHSTLVVNSAVTENASGGGVQSMAGGSTGSEPELVGLVTLVGQPKPEIPIDLGPSCGRINPTPVTTRHYIVGQGGGLANVLVYLENARPAPPIFEGPMLDQIGCMYEPYVLGVVAGQQFTIRNSDPELHNVHATSQINKGFNFGQPIKGQRNRKSFALPELCLRIKCDVHPWMFAYVNVIPHPYFAITDTNGAFRIPRGVLAGNYTVSAVHLKAGEQKQEITINDGERRALQFQFTLPNTAQLQGRASTGP
jgi:hypothetical protein